RPLAAVLEGGRRRRARRGPQRQHHHPRARARGVCGQARPRRGRSGADQGPGRRGMTLLLWLAALPCLYWTAAVDSAPRLQAAGAFVYGADAVLKIDPADLESLGEMLAFVAQLPANDLPGVTDLAVVDDGSAPLGEVLNLLVRRNLLIRIVKAPSSDFGINVK